MPLQCIARAGGCLTRTGQCAIVQVPALRVCVEELIAEIGAAFLCAYAGIQGEQRHEGYIDSWLGLLKADKRAIFRASGQARSASDFVLNLEQQRKQMAMDDSRCMNDRV